MWWLTPQYNYEYEKIKKGLASQPGNHSCLCKSADNGPG